MLRDLYAVYDVVVWKRLRCDMSERRRGAAQEGRAGCAGVVRIQELAAEL